MNIRCLVYIQPSSPSHSSCVTNEGAEGAEEEDGVLEKYRTTVATSIVGAENHVVDVDNINLSEQHGASSVGSITKVHHHEVAQ